MSEQQHPVADTETWVFTHPDVWTVSTPVVWHDGEDDVAFLRRYGYGPCLDEQWSGITLGIEPVGYGVRYAALGPEASYQYAMLVQLARTACRPDEAQCVVVWLPRFPDLMAFLARYGAIGNRQVDQEMLHEIERILEKTFVTWHGHGSSNCCQACDPHLYRRLQQARQARMQS